MRGVGGVFRGVDDPLHGASVCCVVPGWVRWEVTCVGCRTAPSLGQGAAPGRQGVRGPAARIMVTNRGDLTHQ